MAIEAPLSKHTKLNLKIYIAVCLALAIWCAYDGYFNQEWIDKHTDADGKPEPYLVFNQKAPPFFLVFGAIFGTYLFAIGNKKLVAGETELVISDKERISYEAIQKIDKTRFESKGHFIITYKSENGAEINRKISDRTYDNLGAVLDELVARIS